MKKSIKAIYRRLFCNRASYKLNNLLFECSLHGLGLMNFESSEVSGEKHFVQHALPGWLGSTDGPVFVDVGANVGDYTRMLCDQFPRSHVYAIEPHPATFARLTKSLPDNVTSVNSALGAIEGRLVLFDREDCDGSCHASLYEEVITDHHKQSSTRTEVTIDTLDQFVKQHQIERIDLLKIDTEGHELAVLQGAEEAIRNGRIGAVQIEFNALNIYSRTFFRDIRNLLPTFQFFRLLPASMIPIPANTMKSEIFGYQNIVGLNTDSLSNRMAA